MIYAIKKQNESNERLISRFKKLIQRSRLLQRTKQGKYHNRKAKKVQVRQSAVMRAKYRARRERESYMN